MSLPTSEELQLIHIFRRRLQSITFEEDQSCDEHLLRWIRARESNLEKAEDMLRRHIEWRKINGIGPSLLDWNPPVFLTETFSVKLVGFDPTGVPILFFSFGQWDIRKALDKCDKDTLIRYKDQVLEQIMRLMQLHTGWVKRINATSIKTSQTVTQFIGLSDWEGFSLRYIMNKLAVELIVESAKSFEANYPETLKAAFNVNCPKVFTVLFNLIKPFLSERTLSKIFIYDSNVTKWKPALLQTVPKSHLPIKYGGVQPKMFTLSEINLIQEDDSFVGDLVKESLKGLNDGFTKQEFGEGQGFEDKPFTILRVAPGFKKEIHQNIQAVGTRLSWHIQVEDKDIGFSIVANSSQDNKNHTKEIVKSERIQNHLGSVICEKAGNYSILFDNSYSTFKGKVVKYKIQFDNPFEITN